MTAQRPEIQRFDMKSVKVGSDPFDWETSMVPSSGGFYVEYPAHLRAVTLAKIEVLESLPMNILRSSSGGAVCYRTDLDFAIEAKIAALRKELEG